MLSKTPMQNIVAAPRMSRARALKAGLALAAACLVATPALADSISYFPGGEVHTWTGNNGDEFQVTRTYNNGKSVTRIRRRGTRFWVLFTPPPKPVIVRPFGGSLYDPDTNSTTTIIVGPTFRGSTVEPGNTLRDHGDIGRPKYTGRASGSLYDPETNQTTTIVHGPSVSGKTVEKGNTLPQHGDMPAPKYSGKVSGSLFDPGTNQTTTIVGGPSGSVKTVEKGNTLGSHASTQPMKYTGRASGSLFDPGTNRTTTVVHGPSGSSRMVEMGNTLRSH